MTRARTHTLVIATPQPEKWTFIFLRCSVAGKMTTLAEHCCSFMVRLDDFHACGFVRGSLTLLPSQLILYPPQAA